MGGWYDPLSTKPETYLDQARQTILGQAKECMLYSYENLTKQEDSPDGPDGIFIPGIEDTKALRKERPALERLASLVESKKTVGVSVPKQPQHDAELERCLSSFYGLIGIPVDPDTGLNREAPAVILGTQAAGFPEIREYVRSMKAEGRPVAVTEGFVRETGIEGDCLIDITRDFSGKPGFDPKDNWNIIGFPNEELNRIRDALTEPLGIVFRAPSNVALNLYDDDMEVIQNFRDSDIEVTLDLSGRDREKRHVLMTLPEGKKAELSSRGKVYTVKIPARTYVVLGTAAKNR